jgi:hypothetical protein
MGATSGLRAARRRRIIRAVRAARPGRGREARKPRCRVAATPGEARHAGSSPATIARLEQAAYAERLSDQIAELSAHLEAATARLLDMVREFDAIGGWRGGYASCAHWLAWRAGIDAGTARERVRVARALGELPRLAQAFARGELTYAKAWAPYCTSWLGWSVK